MYNGAVMTDSELIVSIRKGNPKAFKELIDRYFHRIYAFALRVSRNPDVAEDAAQETFVKVWKSLKKFDSSRSFQSWIFAIARNATLDILRKRKDSSLDDDSEAEMKDDSELAPEEFDREVTRDILEEVMAELTANQRSAVYLHDVLGKTFDEISEITGKSLNTEKSHYRRAILRLRSKLARRGLHQDSF